MESNITALRARNNAAAAKELRELRADTLEGLEYALYLARNIDKERTCIRNAIRSIQERWSA